MTRKLASIQRIDDLQPIENADSIEVATILGWKVVVKKGEFEIGDLCVYFEIDSIVPQIPYFEFMKDRRYRVRTIKLRGQISQGLAIPTTLLYHFVKMPPELNGVCVILENNIGDDVTELLGVVKYEPELHASIGGDTAGNFPGFISKTDEDRIQSNPAFLEKLHGNGIYSTEKIDGCSFTAYRFDGHFGVCSRNWELLDTETNVYWQMARKYDLPNKLPEGFFVQGEIAGPDIQKNRLKLKERDLFIFNVGEIVGNQRYGVFELIDFCTKYELRTVPFVYSPLVRDIEKYIEFANGPSELNSAELREGIVIRTLDGSISFKVISNEYLLRHKI